MDTFPRLALAGQHFDRLRRQRRLTTAIVLKTLAALPRPLRLGAPPHADDTGDPALTYLMLTPEERRELPRLLPARTRPLPSPRSSVPLSDTLKMVTNAAGTAELGVLFATEDTARGLTVFDPVLRVRVHALICRNDDGMMSDGTPGQSRAALEAAIATAIAEANTIMESGGIELVFYPADVEIRHDTRLNMDFVLPAAAEKKLKQQPPLSPGDAEALGTLHSTTAHRNSVAREYPGKLVLLFAEGNTISFGRDLFGSSGDVPLVGDFDGDGFDDLCVWNPASGMWYIQESNSGNLRAVQWGQAGDIAVPADYDGDGKCDIAVWRPSDGNWHILESSTGKSRTEKWGKNGDSPVPADYDGDGKADIAVWRKSDGKWHIRHSSDGSPEVIHWGQAGDIPVPGHYSSAPGIGAELAVWRPATGEWFIIERKTGKHQTHQWGQAGDIPLPGAKAAKGKHALTVWRKATGEWFRRTIATGAVTSQIWGLPTDVPVPGNWTQDGLRDIAVWRPSEGQWYIVDSATGHCRKDEWVVVAPSAGGFSWEDLEFVKLGGGLSAEPEYLWSTAAFIAHEVGHNLHLWHPFNQLELSSAESAGKTDQQCLDLMKTKITGVLNAALAAGTPMADVLDVLDADLAVVQDTKPDPSPAIFTYLNRVAGGSDKDKEACGSKGSVTLKLTNDQTVTIKPDRTLVMSYFKGCEGFENRFTVDQATRMRNALLNGNRRHLVGVQMGDSAAPNERVCAIWDTQASGQAYSTNRTSGGFDDLDAQRRQDGLRLFRAQAWTRNGETLYDGIWNGGNHQQRTVFGFTEVDFAQADTAHKAQGFRLACLDSYLLSDGQMRINAIWNPGTHETAWVTGWAGEDLSGKVNSMHGDGWRVSFLESWNLPEGPVRYNVVWVPGTKSQSIHLNLTWEGLREIYGSMWNEKFRAHCLSAHRAGDEIRYAAAWKPGSQPQLIVWNNTREQIRRQYDEMWQQGMKLSAMSVVKF